MTMNTTRQTVFLNRSVIQCTLSSVRCVYITMLTFYTLNSKRNYMSQALPWHGVIWDMAKRPACQELCVENKSLFNSVAPCLHLTLYTLFLGQYSKYRGGG